MNRTIMKILLLFVLLSCADSANSQDTYQKIMNGLGKNYVLHGSNSATNEKLRKFEKDSIEYATAISSFYKSDPSIISYLISSFDECEGLSGLIVPFSPVRSSFINPCELMDCKAGVLILIDNFLLSETRKGFVCPDYLIVRSGENLFNSFKNFYEINKGLEKVELKERYKADFADRIKIEVDKK